RGGIVQEGVALAEVLLSVPEANSAKRWIAALLLKAAGKRKRPKAHLPAIDDPDPFCEYRKNPCRSRIRRTGLRRSGFRR
ncbi:MAG: hypothetical protein SNJ73_08915, partial [Acetobacteraceae bacterium]